MNNINGEQLELMDLKLFSEKQLKKLHEYNITTAESFVGTCATPEGFIGIKRVLDITDSGLDQILKQVKDHLSPELVKLLSKPIPTTFHLGARKPRKKQKTQ